MTKTSILYAIKKQDPDATQREPIFFAHVEKVGIDTKKKVCPNHLTGILSRYIEFKAKVLSAYDGVHFNKSRFMESDFQAGRIND